MKIMSSNILTIRAYPVIPSSTPALAPALSVEPGWDHDRGADGDGPGHGRSAKPEQSRRCHGTPQLGHRRLASAPRLRAHRASDEPRLGPPLFKGCVKERRGRFALEFPLPSHAHVLLMIHACPPHGPVALAERAGHEQIPLCPGCVALHVNLPIQTIVARKGEELRGATEELPNRIPAC